MKPEKFLAPEDRERVRAAIAEAERSTAGEIRVMVVRRSAPRPILVPLIVGAAVAVLAYFQFLTRWTWHHPGLLEVFVAAALGLFMAILGIWFIPPGKDESHRSVWERAKREFVRLGIGKTAGATGVLVLFSLFEHEAVVLADKAINDKVPPETWSREVKILLAGVKAGKPADGIAEAVKEIGALLAQHFPRRDDDKNELSDDVVMR